MNITKQKEPLMDKPGRTASNETYAFLNDLQQMLGHPKKPAAIAVPAITETCQCIYVQDLRTKKISGSSGITSLLGYTDSEFSNLGLQGIVHAGDARIAKAVIRMVEDYIIAHEAAGIQTLRLACRVLKKSGESLKVLAQISFGRYFRDPSVVYSSVILSDISFMKAGTQVEWTFDAPGFDPDQIAMYVPQPASPFFSAREIEVLELIDKGLTSQAIADALFISKHTVDTHRRKMLQKTGCPNAIALLEFYRSRQL